MSQNEIKVRFLITDFDYDPDDITSRLSIDPSKTWRVGDSILGTSRRHQENGWRIDADPRSSQDLQPQIVEILDLLEPSMTVLTDIVAQAYAEFSCIVYANEYVPELHLNRQLLQRISSIGAEVDIDLYCMTNESA